MTRPEPPRLDLATIALRLAGQTALWQPLVKYDPISRHYARLVAAGDYEAWLLTWLPGQGTEWHDHGGSAGAFVTVQGTLTERHAWLGGNGAPTILPEARRLGAGSLRAFGTRHVHRVTNDELEPAVSVHVYAPALVEMNTYRPEGDLLIRTASQLVGENW
ncbi:cysteine dioxygenase [Microlunatus speluncae]|uniref:cysteine dioxygenase n=1 Tax=Microlunatus speluncae TaxID=2594267 RepID=UPI0012664B40|nr:cysteine dioxygenase family protein [Microlunatus speluncae]